jgi:hypothetical protein
VTNPDTRRIPGAHSLAGAIIRQAVLDYKIGYTERLGEYSAQWFLHCAGLMHSVDSLYDAIVTNDAAVYHDAQKGCS